tara:strand:- start:7 stop:234 length:228 start_codon:yes stop_codon:yes gene_type:complete
MTTWTEGRWETRKLFGDADRWDIFHHAGAEWHSILETDGVDPSPELVLEFLIKKYPEKKIYKKVKNVHADPYADL